MSIKITIISSLNSAGTETFLIFYNKEDRFLKILPSRSWDILSLDFFTWINLILCIETWNRLIFWWLMELQKSVTLAFVQFKNQRLRNMTIMLELQNTCAHITYILINIPKIVTSGVLESYFIKCCMVVVLGMELTKTNYYTKYNINH